MTDNTGTTTSEEESNTIEVRYTSANPVSQTAAYSKFLHASQISVSFIIVVSVKVTMGSLYLQLSEMVGICRKWR